MQRLAGRFARNLIKSKPNLVVRYVKPLKSMNRSTQFIQVSWYSYQTQYFSNQVQGYSKITHPAYFCQGYFLYG